MLDRLNDIAHLSVLREVLHDLDPVGLWQSDELYVQWKTDRYSLSQSQFYRLLDTLNAFRIQAEYAKIRPELGRNLSSFPPINEGDFSNA